MNVFLQRACSIIMACVVLLSVMGGLGCSHFQRRNEPPALVSDALSRIKTLRPGVFQRDLFALLGLPKAELTIVDERIQDGKSGLMWTRYQIGSTEFVLECLSRVKPYGLEDDAEAGVLQEVLIRQRVHDSKQEVHYVNLMSPWPAWKLKQHAEN